MEILLFAFFVIAAITNIIILIGMANFILKFRENFDAFVKEHREFQEQYYEFMTEVRGKKGLVDIVNRVLPRP
jgi:hypothetical protein